MVRLKRMFLSVAFFLLLLISYVHALQYTCNVSDYRLIALNYTIPLYDNNDRPINNATCNITIAGQLTNLQMLNSTQTGLEDGVYLCEISTNFTDGNYKTQYSCNTDAGTFTNFGSFTVTYSGKELTFVLALIAFSVVFFILSELNIVDNVGVRILFHFMGLLGLTGSLIVSRSLIDNFAANSTNYIYIIDVLVIIMVVNFIISLALLATLKFREKSSLINEDRLGLR